MKVIWWFVGLLQTKKHVKILSIHRWGGLKFFHVYNYFRNEIVRTKFIHTINFVEILSLSNANNKRKKLFKCRVHYVHLYLEKKFFINFVPSISKLPTEIIIMNFNFNWPINKLHSSNLLNEYFFVNFIFHYVIFKRFNLHQTASIFLFAIFHQFIPHGKIKEFIWHEKLHFPNHVSFSFFTLIFLTI